jgi:hypothetical protein
MTARRLTPDVLPYEGYGIQSKEEYEGTMSFLRKVARAPHFAETVLSGPMDSNYRGAMAALRGRLVDQGGIHKDGAYKLTEYGKEYLAQRGGLPVTLPPGTVRG